MSPEATEGDVLDHFEVGPVNVQVKYSCLRRDMYDMTLGRPLPASVRQSLESLGSIKGSDALYVLDVPGVYRVTFGAAAGRVVVMPRLGVERPAQRQAAIDLAERLVAALGEG